MLLCNNKPHRYIAQSKENGDPLVISPRYVLDHLVERARALGYEPMAAAELEFRFFRGADFVEHFVATRRWEMQEYEKAVTNWDRRRYLELV